MSAPTGQRLHMAHAPAIGTALLLLGAAATAQPTVSGTPAEIRQLLGMPTNPPQVVTIRGFAEETAYTDRAIVSLIVTTERRSMAEALQANAALRAEITRTLTSAGIDPEAINNSRFSTSPQFGPFGRNPNNYQVVNRMEVTATMEAHLVALGDVVDQNMEVTFGGTEFEHSEREAFEDRVRQAALDDAMEEKAFYETSLGIELGPVNFRTGPVIFNPRERFLSQALEEVAVTGARAEDAAAQAPLEAPGVPTFDEVQYRANVEIDFEVRSGASR
jgi:uncharacterized protein YggE